MVTGFTHATSADQDQPAQLSCLFIVCTVNYLVCPYLKFSFKNMIGFV
jgi:hypothetical protein